jgi:hypothetical protein
MAAVAKSGPRAQSVTTDHVLAVAEPVEGLLSAANPP